MRDRLPPKRSEMQVVIKLRRRDMFPLNIDQTESKLEVRVAILSLKNVPSDFKLATSGKLYTMHKSVLRANIIFNTCKKISYIFLF